MANCASLPDSGLKGRLYSCSTSHARAQPGGYAGDLNQPVVHHVRFQPASTTARHEQQERPYTISSSPRCPSK